MRPVGVPMTVGVHSRSADHNRPALLRIARPMAPIRSTRFGPYYDRRTFRVPPLMSKRTIRISIISHDEGRPRIGRTDVCSRVAVVQVPDLQNILRQSYDYLTIMPKLRSTYDGRLIYKNVLRRAQGFS